MDRKTPVVRVSVRAVVEHTLHESDLSTAALSARRMREGAAAHRARQSGAMAAEATYRAETALSADYAGEGIILRIAGRADGLLSDADGLAVVEEIKLGAPGMALVPAHRAQAAMYAHMLCERDALDGAKVRVLYVDGDGQPLECFEETAQAAHWAQEFAALCAPVAAAQAQQCARRDARDASLAQLAFPFDRYREGQRKFAANVYVALRDRKRLFAQAPTGIGKTMAALYPALRALGEGLCGRVLFLAARTTGRRSAMEAMERLNARGAAAMAVEITAKDKICPMPVRDCRPECCPYAAGYYDRLPAALSDAQRETMLTGALIAQIAQAHRVCPFEFSLALAACCDVVVCDYNYVFDPVVALGPLMQAAGGAALLVDEAHQLAPRVQDAYSARVSQEELRAVRREAGRLLGRKHPLYRALTGVVDCLKALSQTEAFAQDALSAPPEALLPAMERMQGAAAQALEGGAGKPALDAFSLAGAYLLAAAHFDERYGVCCEGTDKKAALSLLCLDASKEIAERTKRAKGTVFFSATLTPFDAQMRLLGSGEGDACLALPSPFDPAQLDARVLPLDLRYAARERSAPIAAQAIAQHLLAHGGNTIVFFPSYAYLARIYELLLGMDDLPAGEYMRERRAMSEDEKNALLGAFESGGERRVLFAVLGGAFSEGVDLPGDRLKNVIIVSTGMPQPDARIRRTQAYYDALGEDGFFMTMTLPGLVRVIQAAGRLIRTDQDAGSLLLIDSRYAWPRVRSVLAGTLIGAALDGGDG